MRQPLESGNVYYIGVGVSQMDRMVALQAWSQAKVATGDAYIHQNAAPPIDQGRQELVIFNRHEDRSLHILSIVTRYKPQEGRPAGELIFDGVVDEKLQEAGFVRPTRGEHGEERRELI